MADHHQSSSAEQPRRPKPPVREAAMRIVRELADRGYIAYFAGGCVRDKLLGIEPTDYDVATDARPEQVAKVFRRTQAVGESFGVMLVRLMGHTIQVATFRTDGVYSDGRHPDEVTFSDAEHDACRRDFTINGLFEDPLRDEIIDYVGGRADLDQRIIRAIGDPAARIHEDRLRMLRAIRFAARFGFSIEAETAEAIRANAEELVGVSRERIGHEVRRMLTDPNRAVAAWEVQYLGLDEAVLNEPHCANAPTRLGRLPDDAGLAAALSAWLLDRHESDSPDKAHLLHRADCWSEVLMLSNEERRALRDCLSIYVTLRTGWRQIGVARQKRLAVRSEFPAALQLVQAMDREQFVKLRRHLAELERDGLAPDPLLDGRDLIEMGLRPGPVFKYILDSVYDAQLEGAVRDREEARQLARALAADDERGG